MESALRLSRNKCINQVYIGVHQIVINIMKSALTQSSEQRQFDEFFEDNP